MIAWYCNRSIDCHQCECRFRCPVQSTCDTGTIWVSPGSTASTYDPLEPIDLSDVKSTPPGTFVPLDQAVIDRAQWCDAADWRKNINEIWLRRNGREVGIGTRNFRRAA